MPSRLDSCTKIFVGNFVPGSSIEEMRQLFAKYGEVVECDIVRNFCFVHMANEKEAHAAIEALNGFTLNGRKLNVEESTSEVRQKPGMGGSDKCFFCGDGGHWSRDCPKRGPGGRNSGGRSTKIYVGNVAESTTDDELRDLFGKYGTVTECAKVKNYAFIHMKTSEEAELAIEHLRGQVLNGNTLTIEASTSRPRGGGGSGGGRSSAASSSDRYSPRSSAWEGMSRSVRGADRASMLRSADPYGMSSSLALRAYARERAAPYPTAAYLSRYDDRYLERERERYERMRAALVDPALYDRRAVSSSRAAAATVYDRYTDRYESYARDYLASASRSSSDSSRAAAIAEYYAARGYPTSSSSSSSAAATLASSSRAYADYAARY